MANGAPGDKLLKIQGRTAGWRKNEAENLLKLKVVTENHRNAGHAGCGKLRRFRVRQDWATDCASPVAHPFHWTHATKEQQFTPERAVRHDWSAAGGCSLPPCAVCDSDSIFCEVGWPISIFAVQEIGRNKIT